MLRIISVIFMVVLMGPAPAHAEDEAVWIQIQARRTMAKTLPRLQFYSGRLSDVNGFKLRNGWFAVVLGPYTPEEAERLRRKNVAEGAIPDDSFITRTRDYQQQIWPVGANYLEGDITPVDRKPDTTETVQTAPAENGTDPAENGTETQTAQDGVQDRVQDGGQNTVQGNAPETPNIPAVPTPETTPANVDQNGGPRPGEESKDVALAGESALSGAEKSELQMALGWAGVYEGPIDAAFGQGTRAAMALWQEKNNYQQTGILTTGQRAELLAQYNAVFNGMGLKTVHDEKAGIEITLPLELVGFQKYDYPFVHYDPKGEGAARVLLISQEGTENTLKALYDLMQTLAIVPKTGPRELKKNEFTLVGEGEKFLSHTQVWLKDGHVKGFTLIWPVGDEKRRTRLLEKMQRSFTPLGQVLAGTDIAVDDQRVDLMAGLELRKPKRSRTGIYADQSGKVLTVADVTQNCGRLTINDIDATVQSSDAALGLALLQPAQRLSPPLVARFSGMAPQLQSEVVAAGYSYGGVLGLATVSFGSLADLQGLDGNKALARLEMVTQDGDVGGPVLAEDGRVIGVVQKVEIPGRSIPENVSFAVAPKEMAGFLEKAGIALVTANDATPMAAERLTREARKMTVLVECWE